MTQTLVEKSCTPCRGGIPPLTRAEAEELLRQAPEWALMDDAHRIEKTFRFGNFREALAFVQKVGELAEAEGHHPDISFGWGWAKVSWELKRMNSRASGNRKREFQDTTSSGMPSSTGTASPNNSAAIPGLGRSMPKLWRGFSNPQLFSGPCGISI